MRICLQTIPNSRRAMLVTSIICEKQRESFTDFLSWKYMGSWYIRPCFSSLSSFGFFCITKLWLKLNNLIYSLFFVFFFFWVALGFSSCNERFLDSWIMALHTEHYHRSPLCKMGVLCFCHASERTASVVFLWNCKTTLKTSLWVYKKINLGNHYVLFVLSIMCSWSLKGDENISFFLYYWQSWLILFFHSCSACKYSYHIFFLCHFHTFFFLVK